MGDTKKSRKGGAHTRLERDEMKALDDHTKDVDGLLSEVPG